MTIVKYDIAVDPDPNDPNWLDIERIYCFDWDEFSDDDWEQLGAIYRRLPGYMTSESVHFVRWYSTNDDPDNGYLWASVEPPGLQVAGTLNKDDWQNWANQFEDWVFFLPFRQLY